jgi:hypothetical protein
VLLRLLEWVVWCGGWQQWDRQAGRASYRPFRWREHQRRWQVRSLYPLGLCGRRIVLFGWGGHISRRRDYIGWSYRNRAIWISPDSTPAHAHTWLRGAPRDIMALAATGIED